MHNVLHKRILASSATVGRVARTPLNDPSPIPRDVLVGQCPVVKIHVNGKEVQCLVDTGSQVTLFSEGLCKEVFAVQQLQEAEAPWLTLRGANGLDIPYTGYIVADFQVQGVVVPEKGVMVVRDHCLGTHRALLGMNVISACWEELFQNQQGQTSRHTRTPGGREWEHIIADCCHLRTTRVQQEHEDTARVACRYALAIPAHSEALI